MKLSVIIVNYNVKYFLEQCLHSVAKAARGIDVEVFVVDNNSVDGSVQMVADKFPAVRLIANRDNRGFSRANNQAIAESTGEYVLLLNPDTVVEEDTFRRTLQFMDQHPDAGGLGVKMVDGKGRFLPESKRGLPTPAVAFYKISGLSAIFPKSQIFGRYHLGFLDKEQTHEVEILAGAFMLLRRSVLDVTGVLDETFFMYGEDIDLSYRIIKAGYKNYYFPETRIIHYKGESTKKSSVNYVLVFYNAMVIFARKHFSARNAKAFSFLINLAIYLRAFLAIAARFIRVAALPLLDALLIFTGIWFIKNYWEANVIFAGGGHYPTAFIAVAVPVYILVWLLSVYFSGGYDKPVKIARILQGLLVGTILILTVYGLLSEQHRFSRALIILGAGWASFAMAGTRYLLHLFNFKSFRMGDGKNKRFVIAGDSKETERVETLLRQTYPNPGFVGLVNADPDGINNGTFIGNINQLADIIKIYGIHEVIFCSASLKQQTIIDQMTTLHNADVEFKIAPPESISIIGSSSINTGGELYVLNINAISKSSNRRNKRLLDFMISLVLLVGFPLLVFFMKNPPGLFYNIFRVLLGFSSWVGYIRINGQTDPRLPHIRQGVLNPSDAIKIKELSPEILESLNILYAKDYIVGNDLNIIRRGFRDLGRQV